MSVTAAAAIAVAYSLMICSIFVNLVLATSGPLSLLSGDFAAYLVIDFGGFVVRDWTKAFSVLDYLIVIFHSIEDYFLFMPQQFVVVATALWFCLGS